METGCALRIANARGVPGTGAALVPGETGDSLLLSSHHVVFAAGAAAGDRVWAVPPSGAGCPEQVALGRAAHGLLGRVSVGDQVSFVDCALIALEDRAGFPRWLRRAVDALVRIEPAPVARRGMPVVKIGAATGMTRGVLVDTEHREPLFAGERVLEATGQFLVAAATAGSEFAAPGDSGAALLDDAGRMVGLLWGATAAGRGIACPIAAVLAYLRRTA